MSLSKHEHGHVRVPRGERDSTSAAHASSLQSFAHSNVQVSLCRRHRNDNCRSVTTVNGSNITICLSLCSATANSHVPTVVVDIVMFLRDNKKRPSMVVSGMRTVPSSSPNKAVVVDHGD